MVRENSRKTSTNIHHIRHTEHLPINKKTLLKSAIQFAEEHADINKNDFEVIFHARKPLLFYSNQPWIKKDSDTLDVPVGVYHGADICEQKL